MRISLFCILCLLLGACSNEEMIPSTSEGGEECAFQFLLRVPGTIDVETKAGTEILKLGDTNIYNVWILQFKEDGTELLKAVFADRNSITAVPGSSSTTYDQLLIQLMKDDMRFKNETSEFYIIVNAEDMNATEVTAKLFVKEGGLKEEFQLEDQDLRTYSPLTLAYIGDSIFDLVIRTLLVKHGNCPPQKLHERASKLVKASAQAEMIENLMPVLSEEEITIYKRGRNAKSYTKAKNATVADYRKATGLEALMGYLYLKEDTKRIIELIKTGLDMAESQKKKGQEQA